MSNQYSHLIETILTSNNPSTIFKQVIAPSERINTIMLLLKDSLSNSKISTSIIDIFNEILTENERENVIAILIEREQLNDMTRILSSYSNRYLANFIETYARFFTLKDLSFVTQEMEELYDTGVSGCIRDANILSLAYERIEEQEERRISSR